MRTIPKGSRMKTFLAVIFSVMLTFTMMPVMPFMTGDVHAVAGDVEINDTTFPDTNFRAWITTNVTGGSTTLTADMIKSTTSIDVSSKSISSLKGIEYFTALTSRLVRLLS